VSCLDRGLLEEAVDRVVREAELWNERIGHQPSRGTRLPVERRQGRDRSDRYHSSLASQWDSLPPLVRDGAPSELPDDAKS
jgi:hypothetical protein